MAQYRRRGKREEWDWTDQCTVDQKSQEQGRKYWATRSSIRLFTNTTHSFACFALLTLLARSAVLNCSLAHSLTHSHLIRCLNSTWFCPTVQWQNRSRRRTTQCQPFFVTWPNRNLPWSHLTWPLVTLSHWFRSQSSHQRRLKAGKKAKRDQRRRQRHLTLF